MRADQASEYAIEHGGTSFKICPVCDAHFPEGPVEYDWSDITRLRASWPALERVLTAHVKEHTPVEYLTAIVDRDREIALLKARVAAEQCERTQRFVIGTESITERCELHLGHAGKHESHVKTRGPREVDHEVDLVLLQWENA